MKTTAVLCLLAAGAHAVALGTTTTALPPAATYKVTTDGLCGDTYYHNGTVCSSAWGQCCSWKGTCGGEDYHCGDRCKAEGGKCNSAGVDYTNKVLGPGSYSPDGTCGGKSRYNCYGFGTCCSASGYCGSSTDYCGAGCQEAFGLCANWADSITTDGRCGVINGKSCPGSECCSESGYCGGPGEEYCGPGCQPYGGICNPTSNITTDGSCGTNGRTCMGSRFGDCCSASGYCGKTTDYCGTGCQPTYGGCSKGTGG